jgi:hypothetical protein
MDTISYTYLMLNIQSDQMEPGRRNTRDHIERSKKQKAQPTYAGWQVAGDGVDTCIIAYMSASPFSPPAPIATCSATAAQGVTRTN